jgi:hypothetical protein
MKIMFGPNCLTVIHCVPMLVRAPRLVGSASRCVTCTPMCSLAGGWDSQAWGWRLQACRWRSQVLRGAPEGHCISPVNTGILVQQLSNALSNDSSFCRYSTLLMRGITLRDSLLKATEFPRRIFCIYPHSARRNLIDPYAVEYRCLIRFQCVTFRIVTSVECSEPCWKNCSLTWSGFTESVQIFCCQHYLFIPFP